MPRAPNGERRSADLAQRAHKVRQIAVGEDSDDRPSGKRRSGLAGAKARKQSLTEKERSEIARKAAQVQWR